MSHKGLEANYATQYKHMYNDILSVLWHDRSTDRSIDQYKIEKIDRSTKELIVTTLINNKKFKASEVMICLIIFGQISPIIFSSYTLDIINLFKILCNFYFVLDKFRE